MLVTLPYFYANTLFGTPDGTTIVMAAHNNRDILMVLYKDLPDEDKDIISKAIEEVQNKCLLSYTKTLLGSYWCGCHREILESAKV